MFPSPLHDSTLLDVAVFCWYVTIEKFQLGSKRIHGNWYKLGLFFFMQLASRLKLPQMPKAGSAKRDLANISTRVGWTLLCSRRNKNVSTERLWNWWRSNNHTTENLCEGYPTRPLRCMSDSVQQSSSRTDFINPFLGYCKKYTQKAPRVTGSKQQQDSSRQTDGCSQALPEQHILAKEKSWTPTTDSDPFAKDCIDDCLCLYCTGRIQHATKHTT